MTSSMDTAKRNTGLQNAPAPRGTFHPKDVPETVLPFFKSVAVTGVGLDASTPLFPDIGDRDELI